MVVKVSVHIDPDHELLFLAGYCPGSMLGESFAIFICRHFFFFFFCFFLSFFLSSFLLFFLCCKDRGEDFCELIPLLQYLFLILLVMVLPHFNTQPNRD